MTPDFAEFRPEADIGCFESGGSIVILSTTADSGGTVKAGSSRGNAASAPPHPLNVAALELISHPSAVVAKRDGQIIILLTNAGAALEIAEDSGAFLTEIGRGLAGLPCLWRVAALENSCSGAEVFLAVRPISRAFPEPRLSEWVTRHRLTKSKTRVLLHLVRGDSNKETAAALGSAENTVELHVSGILKATGIGSRSELIARFWTDEP